MASADPELPCYGHNYKGLSSSSSSDPVADALEMYHMFKQSAMPTNYSPPGSLLQNATPSIDAITTENYSRPNVVMMKKKKTKSSSLNEPNLSILLAVEQEPNPLNRATNLETTARPPRFPHCKRKAAISLARTQQSHSFKSGGESEDSSSEAYKRQHYCPPKLPQENRHDNEEEEQEEEEEEEAEVVEERGREEGEEEKKTKQNSPTIARSAKNSSKQSLNNNSAAPKASQGYVHLRARRGQATDSHSLAERVRREKISERMKLLQDLVPGCSKTLGKAMMLDEIINYVQSLQHQVEFLSMKLAALSPQMDFQFDNLVIGEKWPSSGATKITDSKNAEEVGSMAFNPGSNMSFQMLLNTPLTLPSHSTDFPHFKGGYSEDALLNAVHVAIN